MGSKAVQKVLDGGDAEFLRQDTPLTAAEEAMLVETITRQRESSVIDALVALLKAGRGPRRILDAIQVAAAEVILETGHPNNFSMAQHGYEYCNTLGWFYDTFEHPRRLPLLFVAASFINRAAEHQANTPNNGRKAITPPPGADAWSSRRLLETLDAALLALRPDEAVALTATYLKAGFDRAPLVQALATAACTLGNDPTTRSSGSACWRTSATPGPPTAIGCSSPAPSTPRGTASTATRWRPTGASPKRWKYDTMSVIRC